MKILHNPAFWIELGMLFSLFLGGLWGSYTELTQKRIANRLSFCLLALGLLGHGMMVWVVGMPALNSVLIITVGLAVALTPIALGLWGFSEAKFFWAASTLFPPTLYPNLEQLSVNLLPVALVLNAALLYLGALLAVELWRARKKIKTANKRYLPFVPAICTATALTALFGLNFVSFFTRTLIEFITKTT